jgi:hypothetical protein
LLAFVVLTAAEESTSDFASAFLNNFANRMASAGDSSPVFRLLNFSLSLLSFSREVSLLDTSFPLLTASPAIALISLLCLFVTTINTQCLVHSLRKCYGYVESSVVESSG